MKLLYMSFQRDLTGNSNLYANVILNTNVSASSVSTTNLSATNASIINLTANTFTYGNISTPNVIATNGYFSNLYITNHSISTINASQANIVNLSTSNISNSSTISTSILRVYITNVSTANVCLVATSTLYSSYNFLDNASITILSSSNIYTSNASIKILNSSTFYAENASANNMSLTTATLGDRLYYKQGTGSTLYETYGDTGPKSIYYNILNSTVTQQRFQYLDQDLMTISVSRIMAYQPINCSIGNFSSLNTSSLNLPTLSATSMNVCDLYVSNIYGVSYVSGQGLLTIRNDGVIIRDKNVSGTAYLALNYDSSAFGGETYGLILEADQTDGAVISAGYQLPLTVTLDGVSQLYNTCANGFRFYNMINNSFATNLSTLNVSNISVSTLKIDTNITVSSISTSSMSVTGAFTATTVKGTTNVISAGNLSGVDVYGSGMYCSNIFVSQQVNTSMVSCRSVSSASTYTSWLSASNASVANLSITTGSVTTMTGTTMNGTTINGSTINASTLSAPSITTTTISGTTMNGSTVNGSTVNGITINGSTINASTLSAPTITTTTISGTTMNGSTVNGSTINGLTINGSTINASTFSSPSITTTTISGTTMNGSTVNGSTVNGITMNGSTINGSTINASTLSSASTTTTNISATNASFQSLNVYSGLNQVGSLTQFGTNEFALTTALAGASMMTFYIASNLKAKISTSQVLFFNPTYVSTGNFSSANVANTMTAGTVNATTGNFSTLNASTWNLPATITTTTVNATTGNFSTLNASTWNLPATITTTIVNSTTGNFSNLNASTWNLPSTITTTTVNATTGNFSTLNASTWNLPATIATTTVNANTGNFSTLNASTWNLPTTITTTTVNATTGNFSTLNVCSSNICNISTSYISSFSITSNLATFGALYPSILTMNDPYDYPAISFSTSTFGAGMRMGCDFPTKSSDFTVYPFNLSYFDLNAPIMNVCVSAINICNVNGSLIGGMDMNACRFYISNISCSILNTSYINNSIGISDTTLPLSIYSASNTCATGLRVPTYLDSTTLGALTIGANQTTGFINVCRSLRVYGNVIVDGNLNALNTTSNIGLGNNLTSGVLTLGNTTMTGNISVDTTGSMVFGCDRRSTYNTSGIISFSSQIGSCNQFQGFASTTMAANTNGQFIFYPAPANISLLSLPVGMYLITATGSIGGVNNFDGLVGSAYSGICWGTNAAFTSANTSRLNTGYLFQPDLTNPSSIYRKVIPMTINHVFNVSVTGLKLGVYHSVQYTSIPTTGNVNMQFFSYNVVKIA